LLKLTGDSFAFKSVGFTSPESKLSTSPALLNSFATIFRGLKIVSSEIKSKTGFAAGVVDSAYGVIMFLLF
jgi:hypothetical protein